MTAELLSAGLQNCADSFNSLINSVFGWRNFTMGIQYFMNSHYKMDMRIFRDFNPILQLNANNLQRHSPQSMPLFWLRNIAMNNEFKKQFKVIHVSFSDLRLLNPPFIFILCQKFSLMYKKSISNSICIWFKHLKVFHSVSIYQYMYDYYKIIPKMHQDFWFGLYCQDSD